MEGVMPSWSGKEERQYEHIKKNSKKRGASGKRAKAIAARTVNKQRRERGETPIKKHKIQVVQIKNLKAVQRMNFAIWQKRETYQAEAA